MDCDALAAAYVALRNSAPRRPVTSPYFVGHSGLPSSIGASNRREEHVAMALVALDRRWPLPDGRSFVLLDYQVPLKAKRTDDQIGKVDLVRITDTGRLVVVELKVKGQAGGDSDAPPTALLEGLRYGAIVDANSGRFRDEIAQRFARVVTTDPPIILIVGEATWWEAWARADPEAGKKLGSLAGRVSERLGVSIAFATMTNCVLDYGTSDTPPRLHAVPQIWYDGSVPAAAGFEAAAEVTQAKALAAHDAHSVAHWWQFVDATRPDDLDGKGRVGRPPVVRNEVVWTNLILPPTPDLRARVLALVPVAERHRHFGSFRSSQALAQSVFGGFAATGRLDLLSRVMADCGRHAFASELTNAHLEMEVTVRTLAEPRPMMQHYWTYWRSGTVGRFVRFFIAQSAVLI